MCYIEREVFIVKNTYNEGGLSTPSSVPLPLSVIHHNNRRPIGGGDNNRINNVKRYCKIYTSCQLSYWNLNGAFIKELSNLLQTDVQKKNLISLLKINDILLNTQTITVDKNLQQNRYFVCILPIQYIGILHKHDEEVI